MNKYFSFFVAALILVLPTFAFAHDFHEVPGKYWAYLCGCVGGTYIGCKHLYHRYWPWHHHHHCTCKCDHTDVLDAIAALDTKVDGLSVSGGSPTDLTPVLDAIAALDTSGANLTPVLDAIAALDTSGADLSPVLTAIANLDTKLTNDVITVLNTLIADGNGGTVNLQEILDAIYLAEMEL